MSTARVTRTRFVTAVAALLVAAALAEAQEKRLSIDAIYDPDARVDFAGSPPTNLTWLDDARYLWGRRVPKDDRAHEWLAVDAASGRTAPLFVSSGMESALASLAGITRAEAERLSRPSSLELNPARTAALLTISDDLYLYDLSAGRAVRLTSEAGTEEEATFSPDGRLVAFVRANNLFVVEVATQREVALTTDGSPEILNGKLDWLYQEEIYGRGRFRAYWWSPDSTRLAFLQLNEQPAPDYTIVDHLPRRPALEEYDYPKAGDPNPTVRLGVARVSGGEPRWVDLRRYEPLQFLIVNVDWMPDSSQVVYQVQDREQTWLDLNRASVAGGEPVRILRETTKAWVNENGNPVWLEDGSFLWISERTGFRHLYHYRADGTEVRQITSGRWDLRTLYGADERTGSIFFAGTERSSLGIDIYRVGLDGSGLRRLSEREGTHRAIFNPAFTHYIDVWSDVTTPAQVRLHTADGAEARVIDANPAQALAEYRLSKPEFLQVKTRDGFVMEAMLIKPPDFDPSRRYPVFQHTYGGPGASQVKNAWGGHAYLFHQLLAQHGFLVWICDNRSASGKGVESQWPVYGRLGELELRDIEDGLAWLKRQPYVDGSRVLLSGWSYGGFMTGYALTHSTSFAAGIIGAPVTDWHSYDSVYTERLMKMPQNNPDGYAATSVVRAASSLHGKALLLHGTIDDNVHLQNTVQLAYELQQAGKPFEMMLYPKARHGIADPRQVKHLRQTMFDFVMRTIGPGTGGTPPPTAAR